MPFWKRQQPPGSLPDVDKWSVSETVHGGWPMLVRLNVSAKGYAGNKGLPIRLGIAVRLTAPDERGFPGSEESAQLNVLEDALFEAFKSAKSGRIVLIISTGGMREFVSYVRSFNDAEKAMALVRGTNRNHEVQHYIADDPKWELFREFA